MMWIRNDILMVVAEAALNAAEMARDEVVESFALLEHRYAQPGNAALWERLLDAASLQDPDAWRWVGSLPTTQEILLLVRDGQGQCGFRVAGGDALTKIFDATPGFEFYLTDRTASYVLAHNHHDMLIGAGAAAEWILARQTPSVP